MKIVGLTGGIGSGKTTVAQMFQELGIPVYIADTEAKKLTQNSKTIKSELIALLGEGAVANGLINTKFIADKIFNDPKLLKAVNGIIHPRVKLHFNQWVSQQSGDYVIKEAAILFENGGYKECDLTILVVAPKAIRTKRILNREKTTREAIEARMKNQWPDSKKKKLATIILENIDLAATRNQVENIHKILAKNH